tara:strand:+ start:3026 stop:4249 length:1224 start_codon:yes stop_codon:yes gene_type:complete
MFKYNILLYILSPFILLKLLFYSYKNSTKDSYLSNKLFGDKNITKKSIWIHAASLGEMKIAINISKHLIENGHRDILISSNTPSSKYIFDNAKLDNVQHCYLPFDFYLITKKFVNLVSAKLLIVIETEIWPNLYNLCSKSNTKIIIINARFNPPNGLLRVLSKNIYGQTLNLVDHIYCKSQKDKSSFLKYVNKEHISDIGNIKHALVNEDMNAENLINRKYVLLASSHHREEIIVIKEWLKLKSNKHLLVVAPRHPERLGDILSDIPLSGINIAIRSKNEKIRNSTQIYIADTVGEMNSLIKFSEYTIFGGSFVDVGGHSFMEAAVHSKAIIVGPYMYNFVDETEEFLKNNALIMCQKPEMLKNIFEKLFRSKSKREVFEKNAKKLVESKKLILQKYISSIQNHINS